MAARSEIKTYCAFRFKCKQRYVFNAMVAY